MLQILAPANEIATMSARTTTGQITPTTTLNKPTNPQINILYDLDGSG